MNKKGAPKKYPNRITLRFDPDKPDHQYTVDILNACQGRIADEVADAIVRKYGRPDLLQSIGEQDDHPLQKLVDRALENYIAGRGIIVGDATVPTSKNEGQLSADEAKDLHDDWMAIFD